MAEETLEKHVLVELAEPVVDEFIRLGGLLQNATEPAVIRSRYELATGRNLTDFREIYEREAKEKESLVGSVAEAVLGMYTSSLEDEGAALRRSDFYEYWAICQNPRCEVTRAGIGYFPVDVPEEQVVFTPEALVYRSEPFRRKGMISCRKCGLEEIATKRAAKIQVYRNEESDSQRREQVKNVLLHLAQNRDYVPKEAKWFLEKKYSATLRILADEFAKYYPSIGEIPPKRREEIDLLLLYPIFEKQAHYLLDMEQIPTMPRGWGKLLKKGILGNVNPPGLVIVQNSKSAESLLAKLVEEKYSPTTETPMDIHRFRAIVQNDEQVRRLKAEISKKINDPDSGWSLVGGRKDNPEDTYAKGKIRRDGTKVPLYRVQFYVDVGGNIVEIQLTDYHSDQLAHVSPEVGEEAFWEWRESFRKEKLEPPLGTLFFGLTNPEECAKNDPVTYFNLLLDSLERQLEQKDCRRGAQQKQEIMHALTLNTLFNHRDTLGFAGLSPHDTNKLEERVRSIRERHFIPLKINDEWAEIYGIQKDRTPSFYFPTVAGTPENFVHLGLRKRHRESRGYLIGLGVRPTETDRLIGKLGEEIEEIVSHVHVEEEGKKRRRPVYKYISAG